MGTKRWADLKAKRMTTEQLARLDRKVKAELLAMDLRELRRAAGKTQEEVAALADMTQGELSRLERRDDYLLSTLKRYVSALGGELEVVAVVGGKRIRLSSV